MITLSSIAYFVTLFLLVGMFVSAKLLSNKGLDDEAKSNAIAFIIPRWPIVLLAMAGFKLSSALEVGEDED